MSDSKSKSSSGLFDFKLDNWKNVFTGMGFKNRDKGAASYAEWRPPKKEELDSLFSASDVARTLCELVPYEGTREFIKFTGENKDMVNKWQTAFDEWEVRENMNKAWTLSKKDGAGFILMVTGAQDMSEPLDIDRIGSEGGLKNLIVFNRWECQPNKIDGRATSRNYGKPLTYLLTPSFNANTSDEKGIKHVEVHYTRLLRLDGLELSRDKYVENNYCHDSVLSATKRAVQAYENAHTYSVSALSDFSVPIIKLKGLANLFAAGKSSVVTNRLDTMNMCRSTLRMIALDQEEDFNYINRNLSAVPQVVEKAEDRLVVASRMPRTRILGDASKGLGNEGKSDDRKWYDFVRNQQQLVLSKPLDMIMRAMAATKTLGLTFEGIEWDFVRLWQLTKEEESTVYKQTAESDRAYIEMGVLSADDARKRFESPEFDTTLHLEPNADEMGDEPLSEEERAAVMQGIGDIQTQMGAGEADPQTSLNGAQITSLLEVIGQLNMGQLPEATARSIIKTAFNLSDENIERLFAPLLGFKPQTAVEKPRDAVRAPQADGQEVRADVIEKEGSEWVVKSEKGKELGRFKTEKAAQKRLREIEFFKEKDK